MVAVRIPFPGLAVVVACTPSVAAAAWGQTVAVRWQLSVALVALVASSQAALAVAQRLLAWARGRAVAGRRPVASFVVATEAASEVAVAIAVVVQAAAAVEEIVAIREIRSCAYGLAPELLFVVAGLVAVVAASAVCQQREERKATVHSQAARPDPHLQTPNSQKCWLRASS